MGLCLRFFAAPDFKFHIKSADGVDEDEQKNRILGTIEVTNAPRKRNDREVDQVRVKRGPANAAHQRDAEEPRQKALPRKKAQHEHPVNENRETMMHKVVVSGIHARAHKEEATVQGKKQQSLRHTADKILLEEIENALVMETVKNHAEQVLENTNRSEHMEESILGIEPLEPKIVRRPKNDRPEDSRNEHGTEQHPQRATVLLKEPAAEPRRNGIAQEKACQRPRRFIEFHPEIGHDGPREREVHKEASPRVEHL